MRYPVNAVDSLVWVIGPNEEWAAAISAAAHSIFPNFSKRLGVDPGGFGSRPAAPLSGDGLARWRQFRLITTARLPSSRTPRSEEHTSELQSLMRTSYAVFCLKKKTY